MSRRTMEELFAPLFSAHNELNRLDTTLEDQMAELQQRVMQLTMERDVAKREAESLKQRLEEKSESREDWLALQKLYEKLQSRTPSETRSECDCKSRKILRQLLSETPVRHLEPRQVACGECRPSSLPLLGGRDIIKNTNKRVDRVEDRLSELFVPLCASPKATFSSPELQYRRTTPLQEPLRRTTRSRTPPSRTPRRHRRRRSSSPSDTTPPRSPKRQHKRRLLKTRPPVLSDTEEPSDDSEVQFKKELQVLDRKTEHVKALLREE